MGGEAGDEDGEDREGLDGGFGGVVGLRSCGISSAVWCGEGGRGGVSTLASCSRSLGVNLAQADTPILLSRGNSAVMVFRAAARQAIRSYKSMNLLL